MPYYMGCVKTPVDFTKRAVSIGDMTIEKCMHTCDSKGFRFAHLQAGFQHSDKKNNFFNFKGLLSQSLLAKYPHKVLISIVRL